VAVQTGQKYKELYRLGFQNVADGRINGVAALTGFSNSKMYVRLAGTKNQWPNNEVTIFTRRL